MFANVPHMPSTIVFNAVSPRHGITDGAWQISTDFRRNYKSPPKLVGSCVWSGNVTASSRTEIKCVCVFFVAVLFLHTNSMLHKRENWLGILFGVGEFRTGD